MSDESRPAATVPATALLTGGGGVVVGSVGTSLAHGMTQEQTAIVVLVGAIASMATVMWAQFTAERARREECEREKLALAREIAALQDLRRTDGLAMQERVMTLTQTVADAMEVRS